MATLRYGSTGDDVRRLQQALNSSGYKIGVDGIYGNETQNAVRQYQQKYGLSVDGIAGNQTLGRLYGGSTADQAAQTAQSATDPTAPETQQAAPQATLTAKTAMGTTYDPAETTGNQADLSALEAKAPTYQQTQALTDALTALQGRLSERPADYVSPYQDRLAALYEEATAAREPFQYDPNGDPLYQMYRDRYTQAARQSMQDSMANAAALTGGYGNSYAAAAGQLAYDQQMAGLNDALPELYSQAYDRWRSQGDDVVRRLQLMQQADETEYGRYNDRLADYYDRLNAERTLANDMYNREYGEYQDRLGAWQNARDYYYGKTQDDLAQANYENELALSLAGSSGGGGGGGGGSKSSGGSGTGTSSSYKTVSKTAAGMDPKDAYAYIGRMVDGGYISPEEGERILGVEMGLDLSKYAGGGGNGGSSTAMMAPIPNLVQKLADAQYDEKLRAYGTTETRQKAQETLNKLYDAAGLTGNTGSKTPATVGPVATQANSTSAQKAQDAALQELFRKKLGTSGLSGVSTNR